MVDTVAGQVLKSLRKKAGLTQEQLAHEADLDRTYISLLERGLRTPTINTIFKLSTPLSIPPEEFIRQIRLKYENQA